VTPSYSELLRVTLTQDLNTARGINILRESTSSSAYPGIAISAENGMLNATTRIHMQD
jgi:hypothetical protein